MSIRDYITYRKLEREFDPIEFGNEYIGDPEHYINGIREGKRNAIKGIIKKSLITLVTLASLGYMAHYPKTDLGRYESKVIEEAARKADLNGDGNLKGKEIELFYTDIPGLINFIRL